MMLPKAILVFPFLVGMIAAKDILPYEDGDNTDNTVTISKRVNGVKFDLYRDTSVRPPDMNNEALEDVYLFSSVAVFPEGTTITKSELIRIAHDAHKVVQNEKGLLPDQTPTVMSALLVGNEVYLSSSAKFEMTSTLYVEAGGNPATKPNVPQQVRTVLDACFNNAGYASGTHFNEAKCGEIMALWAYFKRNPDKEQLPRNSVSAAWGFTSRKSLLSKTLDQGLVDPCDQKLSPTSFGWGCKDVLPMFGVQPILESDNIKEATSGPDSSGLWQVPLEGNNCNPVKKSG